MNRFERSWLLFKSSLMVIIQNKRLLIFPIFISAATIVIFLFFFAPVLLWPNGYSYFTAEHWSKLINTFVSKTGSSGPHQFTYSPFAIAYFVFLYFVSMFTATFFNVAFYNEILAALSGQEVSLSRGLRFACTRWKAILMWTAFAGLIGIIIKCIEQRFDIVGKIVARLIGVAWSIASVFVIPVIVRDEENANPFSMLRKSAGILTQTWGESLIGYIGMGFINTIVAVGSLITLGVTIFATKQMHQPWLIALEVFVWVVAMVCWGYLMNVANLVYKGALYLYAAERTVCEPYNEDLLNSAWKFKR